MSFEHNFLEPVIIMALKIEMHVLNKKVTFKYNNSSYVHAIFKDLFSTFKTLDFPQKNSMTLRDFQDKRTLDNMYT